MVRRKEFGRGPEASFWVFIFRMLLALGLGFAFRDKAPDKISVAVIDGPSARARLAALKTSPALLPAVMSEEEGRVALRRGKVSLLVGGEGTVTYRFDPTRPDSRAARREAEDALQRGAGRRDLFVARDAPVHEQGVRYIDFLIPGLLGMNIMSTCMWSISFSVVNARMNQ